MKVDRDITAAAGRTAAWVTLVTALGLLGLASMGQLSPTLDVLSHLSGHLWGAALSATAALLIGRAAPAILATGMALTVIILVGLSYASPREFPSRLETAAGSATSTGSGALGSPSLDNAFASQGAAGIGARRDERSGLKVISLNSWHSNASPQKIVQYLKRAQADVVILIEWGPGKLKLLRQLKLDYPHQVQCSFLWYCSLALISRLPFTAARALPPTRSRSALIWARIALNSKTQDDEAGRHVTVIGTHIYRPSSRPGLHAKHLKQLAGFVSEVKGPYILAGDFNATPWSQSYLGFLRDSGLKSPGRMLPSWPAWPLALPQFAIDHLFVSQELTIRARGVGRSVGSDHLPIWAVVAWH